MSHLLGDKTPGRTSHLWEGSNGNTGPTKVHSLASPRNAPATRIPSNLLNNNEKEKLRQTTGKSEGRTKDWGGGGGKGHKT